MKSLHPSVRLVAIALSIAAVPISAMLCRGISRLALDGYHAFLKGKPLPAITSFWVIPQAETYVPIVISCAVALLLASVTWFFIRQNSEWKITGQILVLTSTVGFVIILFGITFLAAVLPMMRGPISRLNTTEQDAAANP